MKRLLALAIVVVLFPACGIFEPDPQEVRQDRRFRQAQQAAFALWKAKFYAQYSDAEWFRFITRTNPYQDEPELEIHTTLPNTKKNQRIALSICRAGEKVVDSIRKQVTKPKAVFYGFTHVTIYGVGKNPYGLAGTGKFECQVSG